MRRLAFGHNIEAADPYLIFNYARPVPSNDGQGFWDSARHAPVPAILDLGKAAGITALRYPGGCLAHNFDWKKTIGPLADRPMFKFGLNEYLQLCRALGAEPVIIISDYHGTAQDAADLVEYLNAPAIAANPWALKRMENGHAKPFGVRLFELGNESDHGNHQVKPFRRFSPAGYVSWARENAAKMRAVDPDIRLGIVAVPGDAQNIDEEWNRIVFRGAGPVADFIILHFYTPRIGANETDMPRAQQACMAVGAQFPYRLGQYRKMIRDFCGRDLPLAVTEYNVEATSDRNGAKIREVVVERLHSLFLQKTP
ncbi:MAG: hypothetical protein LBK99_19030 [Opitutaceae bacterium]|nr:hypothetical protein [Opitutaceae bacterium]